MAAVEQWRCDIGPCSPHRVTRNVRSTGSAVCSFGSMLRPIINQPILRGLAEAGRADISACRGGE
jgi:hypothetical protein